MGGGINGTSSRRDAETGTTWLVFEAAEAKGPGCVIGMVNVGLLKGKVGQKK